MKINQAYKYELKPNKKQEELFIKSCGVARFAYNWGLADRIKRFNENEGKDKFATYFDQDKLMNQLKKTEYQWMYDVSKWCISKSLNNVDKAFINFWRDRKIGRKTRFPKFKKKGIHDSFTLYGSISVNNKGVQLPRLGIVKSKEPTCKLKGKIKHATVSREADRWYVSLTVERERQTSIRTDSEVVGIDLGIKDFAIIYNGSEYEHIENQKHLAKKDKLLRMRSRQHSKKQKGSNNRKKLQIKLAKTHRKAKNARTDFLHKITSSLAKTKRVIAIEDLQVKNMSRNHHLARSITDAGWGNFKRMLEYKTVWYGSELIVLDKFYPSSKTCSECGAIKKNLKLSDRIWVCLECGAILNRDENAAKNIRNRGIEILNTARSAGINACGVASIPDENQLGDDETGTTHTMDSDMEYAS